MNFQEIHSYYKTLAIADFLPTSLRKVKRLFLPPIKMAPGVGLYLFCTEGSLSILMPDDGLSIGNSIEHMPIGLMERYCPLAKFEYTGSAPVTLRKITYATFDRLFIANHPQRF